METGDTSSYPTTAPKVVDNTPSAPLMDDDDLKKDNQPFGGYTVEKKDVVYRPSEIIGQAITTMEHDIKLSELECKENMEIINGHFEKLFALLTTKKEELVSSLNAYYDSNKNETEQRIKELKAKQIEEEEKEQDVNYNPIMATMQTQQFETSTQSKQIFKKMKKLASKKNATEEDKKEEPMTKMRNKLRVFFPAKTLNKLIDEEIRIGTDYWNALKLDHTKWTVHDSKIWRVQNGSHWCNAFGSAQIGYTQKKKWDVRILAFGNCDLSKAADVVIGIVDADKVGEVYNRNKGKRGAKNVVGFWDKGFDGFGFWGWNGKILHGSSKPAVYTENKGWNVNSVVSVELDMRLDVEGASGAKKKAKFVKNKEKKGMIATGATITFYVDGKSLGYAFYDVDASKKYVLAVAMNQNHYVLQLLN